MKYRIREERGKFRGEWFCDDSFYTSSFPIGDWRKTKEEAKNELDLWVEFMNKPLPKVEPPKFHPYP